MVLLLGWRRPLARRDDAGGRIWFNIKRHPVRSVSHLKDVTDPLANYVNSSLRYVCRKSHDLGCRAVATVAGCAARGWRCLET